MLMVFHMRRVAPCTRPCMSRISRMEGATRADPLLLGDELLEDVVLGGAAQLLRGDPLLLGGGHVERQQHDGRRVDGHGGADLVQGDPVEQPLHVVQRGHRDALPAHLAQASGRGPGRSPSGWACRRRWRGRSAPARAGTGSARWSPRACRSRRTCAWSTACRGTCWGGSRGCKGTRPGSPICSLGGRSSAP